MSLETEIVLTMPNADYHALHPIGEHYFSSSQIKDAYKNVGFFVEKHIKRTIDNNKDSKSLRVGSGFHALLLEPHVFGGKNPEIVVYKDTKSRRGEKWNAFQAKHAHRTILTESEMEEAQFLADLATKDQNIANLLKGSDYEISFFLAELMGFPVKARADIISAKRGFVADLKSTSVDAQDADAIKGQISQWGYDLSAAFYMDIFNTVFKLLGYPERIDKWYWAFVSASKQNSKVYQATDEMIQVGRYKYQQGLRNMYKAAAMDWEIPNQIEYIGPAYWDREFLDQEETYEAEELTSEEPKKRGRDLL